jgi:hypothetical protein
MDPDPRHRGGGCGFGSGTQLAGMLFRDLGLHIAVAVSLIKSVIVEIFDHAPCIYQLLPLP